MAVKALAWVLMDWWSLDPTPAYFAAWSVVLAVAGFLGGIVYLVINGG